MTEQEFFEKYDSKQYHNLSLATDIVTFSISSEVEENYRKLPKQTFNILLMKRNIHPFKGKWALPGGFVRENETLEETAKRELMEETGIKNAYFEQLFTFSELNRDPRMRIVSTSYMAFVNERQELFADTDSEDTAWFQIFYELEKIETSESKKIYSYSLVLKNNTLELHTKIQKIRMIVDDKIKEVYEILSSDLSFDHGKIIAIAIERLRGKIEYTPIAFNLLPKEFTISYLQKVYELILGKKLLDANFRRKVLPLIEETGKMLPPVGHRTAKLFQLKKTL